MLLDTLICAACSLPTTVQASSVSAAPGPLPSSAASATPLRAVASIRLSCALRLARSWQRTAPTMQRSMCDCRPASSSSRLGLVGCAGLASGFRAIPGTRVQCSRFSCFRAFVPSSGTTSGAPVTSRPLSVQAALAPPVTVQPPRSSTGRRPFSARISICPSATTAKVSVSV